VLNTWVISIFLILCSQESNPAKQYSRLPSGYLWISNHFVVDWLKLF